MRIWDINPGYLNRQSLLGEHRELHGMVSIFMNNKKGYSRHPETLRWVGYGWALKQRHQLITAEMALRGYTDRTPVNLRSNKENWPEDYIDEPPVQFQLLQAKYATKEHGRIPLPKTAQQLWRHHKYSVMARDTQLYKNLGRLTANMSPKADFSDLTRHLTLILRQRPTPGGIYNSLLHMWGYVSSSYTGNTDQFQNWSHKRLLNKTQKLVMSGKADYLMSSTALSELASWL